jgi:Tol biopolymer transport system component
MKQAAAVSAALTVVVGSFASACGGNGGEPQIAFVRFPGFSPERADVYVMNADGSGQRRLTRNSADDAEPAWSPDGRSIAFESDRDGNFDVYLMNADGRELRKLTRNPAAGAEPGWSPDGRSIVFDSKREGNSEIYVMEADGSGPRRLTRNPAEDDWPVWWSPSRRK